MLSRPRDSPRIGVHCSRESSLWIGRGLHVKGTQERVSGTNTDTTRISACPVGPARNRRKMHDSPTSVRLEISRSLRRDRRSIVVIPMGARRGGKPSFENATVLVLSSFRASDTRDIRYMILSAFSLSFSSRSARSRLIIFVARDVREMRRDVAFCECPIAR